MRKEIGAHLERYLGPTAGVWHEIVSENVQVDILIWAPTDQRPAYTLVTAGMSDLPMTLPPGAYEGGVARRAELMLCLPRHWPMPFGADGAAAWRDPDAAFPVQWLKTLARLPHDYDSFLSVGHTIPNGDPPRPLARTTRAAGWALITPMTLPADFRSVDLGQERVDLLGLVAIHPAEMEHKLARGFESLFDGLTRRGINECLNVGRPSLF